ncbi:uncharacterized protein LOC113550826 [Rhopalosiphum maidis]|uniref:uncharacterized protein LOC113550826 n=1 Tax=Rhopalosiphum maidis TaxID=43146 RepID=UPI000EFF8A8A|nr:uncharacterized protein LOC113550826 [Rhopalosiphum maidis]
MPITRRRTADVKRDRDSTDVHDGYRHSFDTRIVPVWLAYVALDAFIIYFNYTEASGYEGKTFRKRFEDSYCFAVIELACTMFYGRRHKAAALTGSERTLAFIRDAARGGTVRPPDSQHYSAAVMAACTARIWLYVASAVPAAIILARPGQSLATFQYHVLGRGYARVNRLLEAAADAVSYRSHLSPDFRSLATLVDRLADTCDDFGRQVGHLNLAYTPGLLLRWPYSLVRLTTAVFRISELSVAAQDGRPYAHMATVLIVEHAGEILLFLVQLSSFCYAGACLSYQARA